MRGPGQREERGAGAEDVEEGPLEGLDVGGFVVVELWVEDVWGGLEVVVTGKHWK